jgi:hypothetical protein
MTPLPPLPLTLPNLGSPVLPPQAVTGPAQPTGPAPAVQMGALPALPALPTAAAVVTPFDGDDEFAELVGFSQPGADLRADIAAQTRVPPPADGQHNVAVTMLCKREWVPELGPDGTPIIENGKQKGAQVETAGKYVRLAQPPGKDAFLVMRIQYSILNESGAVVTKQEDEISTSPRRNGSMSMLDFARAVAAAQGHLPQFTQLCAVWNADLTKMARYIRDYMLQQQQAAGSVSLPAVIQSHFMPRITATPDYLKTIKSPREREYITANGMPDKAHAIYGLEKIKKAAGGQPRPQSVTLNGIEYHGSTSTDIVQWGPAL